LKDILKTFINSSDTFIGKAHVAEHSIDTGSSKPINVRPHMLSPYVEKRIEEELDRMLKLGFVEMSNSPYCNPIVVVNKKNGNIECVWTLGN
jgi:hypothetical protein